MSDDTKREYLDTFEATELYLEEFPLPENKLPITTTFEANYV